MIGGGDGGWGGVFGLVHLFGFVFFFPEEEMSRIDHYLLI